MAEALVVFTPSGRRGRFQTGTTVLQAAQELGVDIDSVCGGRAICGRCQVLLSEGSFPKHGIESNLANLSAHSDSELEYDRQQSLAQGRRLGCSTKILGDVVIDVPADSQVHRQVIRKRIEVHDIDVDPLVRLHFLDVPEPNMHDPAGDLQRLFEELEFEWGLTGLGCDRHVLEMLQSCLKSGERKVTVAVYRQKQIIATWAGFKDRALGIAVDVGSTTIAVHLCDLSSGEVLASSGMMNPQIRFGEDLMSRVSYVMMHPGGDKEMTQVVRAAIVQLAQEVCRQAGYDTTDVLDATFVGNPVMHHLLLGISPIELGGAPFALTTDQAIELKASELDLDLHPGARSYVLPCIAGHVGADTAAVVLSEAPYLREEITLLVDVGTNAEIVLGNRHRMLAASSPTGPAFEGAQISCGQRAAPGAIERVRVDRDTLEPRFKVIGSDLWSDETGFDQSIADYGVTGICALYAGIRLLMDGLGIQYVDRIRLAGAFGSHIDVMYAMVLGLIPDCDLDNVTSAGNAAGTGAHIALVDQNARQEIEKEVRRIEKIETAVEPRFQEHFVAAMAIPHQTAEFPQLAKAVALPSRKDASHNSGKTSRRKRRQRN